MNFNVKDNPLNSLVWVLIGCGLAACYYLPPLLLLPILIGGIVECIWLYKPQQK